MFIMQAAAVDRTDYAKPEEKPALILFFSGNLRRQRSMSIMLDWPSHSFRICLKDEQEK